jgi:phosphoribosylglycinamide formyltransferase 1
VSAPRRRTAILISGRGSNMEALLRATAASDFPAETVLVFSNKADAGGLAIARGAGIATATLSHRDYPSREDFDRAVDAVLVERGVELVCLAGFMRVVSAWFCERWLGRMISIHPALLPSFKGLDTHARALEAGVKIHGASVHYVVPELDAGPIIAQAAVPVLDDDTPDRLAARVLRQEHVIYPRALQLVASGKVRLANGRAVSDSSAEGNEALTVPAARPLAPSA